MNKKILTGLGVVGVVVVVVGVVLVLGFDWIGRQVVSFLGDPANYASEGSPDVLKAEFVGPDSDRARLEIGLEEVATGFTQPVDLQFVPGAADLMVVVEKTGAAKWVSLSDPTKSGVLLEEEVVAASEQGLLGLVFHPKFAQTGLLYTNATVKAGGKEVSQVAEWAMPPGADLRTTRPSKKRVLMEVEQPYQNHNAGQLAFGPDGYLYIGWGDGGLADDPKGHGQNTETMLGAMLRVDVNAAGEKPYTVPADNPFVGKDGVLPEIWAYGFRNPWRYAFVPDGRMIVADVGQDLWEEITVVAAGENHGWKIREGERCFEPKTGCRAEGLTGPIYVYDHSEGTSVTGGYVYTGGAIGGLSGRYVFADFTSGRIWAIPVPAGTGKLVGKDEVQTLGKWPLLISTFGRDAAGELYLADFAAGRVFRLKPAAS